MPHSTASETSGEAGFSLVEVLAAVAIMAVALVALYRGAGESRRAAQFMEMHLGARTVARSLIEDARQATVTSADHREGDSGPYHWQLAFEPVKVPDVGDVPGHRFYHMQALVTWQPSGSFVLDTLVLGK